MIKIPRRKGTDIEIHNCKDNFFQPIAVPCTACPLYK